MKYFDEYRFLFVKSDSANESKILHKLFFDNDITWNGEKIIADRAKIGYFILGYYPNKLDGKLIGFVEEINTTIEENFFNNSNKIIYRMCDYKTIECLIKYGYSVPSYKPKKILRNV